MICTVVLFQVFLSNTNNYMVSSNYFYLRIVICLHTVVWFQVFLAVIIFKQIYLTRTWNLNRYYHSGPGSNGNERVLQNWSLTIGGGEGYPSAGDTVSVFWVDTWKEPYISQEYGFCPACWKMLITLLLSRNSFNIACVLFYPVCFRICRLKFDLSEKEELHNSQEYGFSPVCIRICPSKLDLCENVDWHTSQGYGFSPVCVRMCRSKLDFREKEASHTSHVYGFSPECVCLWFLKIDLLQKERPHTSQKYGFSPVCVRIWSHKLDFLEEE